MGVICKCEFFSAVFFLRCFFLYRYYCFWSLFFPVSFNVPTSPSYSVPVLVPLMIFKHNIKKIYAAFSFFFPRWLHSYFLYLLLFCFGGQKAGDDVMGKLEMTRETKTWFIAGEIWVIVWHYQGQTEGSRGDKWQVGHKKKKNRTKGFFVSTLVVINLRVVYTLYGPPAWLSNPSRIYRLANWPLETAQ